jgi:hypothetical protein
MTYLLIFQKSAPDLTNVLLLLIGILAFLFLLSSAYDWFKSKPWQKIDKPEQTISNNILHQHSGNASLDNEDKKPSNSDLFDEQALNTTAIY